MSENKDILIGNNDSVIRSIEVSESSLLKSQIDKILSLPDDSEIISDYIERRKESLGKNPIRKLTNFDTFLEPIVEGFFDNEMKIQPGAFLFDGATFSIDDDKIYKDLINSLKGYSKFLQTHLGGDYHQLALRAVQTTTTYYFGTIQPSAKQRDYRTEKFNKPINQFDNYSIADNKDAAMCSERAAVAHNLLLFLGDNSQYVAGYLNEVSEQGNNINDTHAYVLTRNKDGNFEVFDPSNPILRYTDNKFQKVSTLVPYIIETNSNKKPRRGQKYEGQFSYQYMENGENKLRPMGKRIYSIGSQKNESTV